MYTTQEKAIFSYIDEHQDELFSLLSDLIQINSENYVHTGNESACAEKVRELYRDLGLDTELYYPDDLIRDNSDYLEGRGTDHRPNVGGLYRGSDGKRSVMLAAHLDTMPVGNPEDWTVPPLGGLVRDGRIYGRGAGDNKFGIALGVYLIRALQNQKIRLKEDVVLSAYCDEEYGGGNGSIASCVKYPCDMYINLDGGNSDREIWTSAVGGQVLRAELTAREMQDSASLIVDGLNIVRQAVEEFGKCRREELQNHRFYRDTDMQRSAMRILSYQCGDAGTGLSKGSLEFVFYTVSEKAQIMREIHAMELSLQQKLSAIGIDFMRFLPGSRYFEAISADETDPAIRLLLDCASEVEGKTIRAAGACLTDYFLYYLHGSPCSVTCGVFRDFKLYGGAHQPDEFINCEQLISFTKTLALFLLRWSGANEIGE